MTTYLIRRLFWLIPVLLTVSAVTFIIMRAAPGSPWDTSDERRQVDASTQKSIAAFYGLDKPIWRQFTGYVIGDWNSQTGKYVCGMICGNLGPSYRQRGRSVQDILFGAPEGRTFWQSRFGYSLRLGVTSLSFAVFIGIPIGIIAALKQNTIWDYSVLFLATSGISFPSFVLDGEWPGATMDMTEILSRSIAGRRTLEWNFLPPWQTFLDPTQRRTRECARRWAKVQQGAPFAVAVIIAERHANRPQGPKALRAIRLHGEQGLGTPPDPHNMPRAEAMK